MRANQITQATRDIPEKIYNKQNRLNGLDILRGSAILFAILYHTLYDVYYVFNFNMPFLFSGWFDIIHEIFLVILIIVSGICTSFSHNIYKRAGFLIIVGEIITIITSIFIPDQLIVFGVITFFGSIMMIYGLTADFFRKIPWKLLAVICILLFIVFLFMGSNGTFTFGDFSVKIISIHNNEFLYPLGLLTPEFESSDYFPLIPYGFLFIAGTAFSVPVKQGKLNKLFYSIKCRPVEFIGRHSLVVYLVHQPVIFGIVYLIHTILY